MIDPEAFSHEPVLGFDHVDVAITRKLRAQSVARFARSAVTDIVGQDDEVFRRVEELAGAEQLAGKVPSGELAAGAAGAVHHQHSVADDTAFVLPRLPQRPVMDWDSGSDQPEVN